jgi:hypothetical protein
VLRVRMTAGADYGKREMQDGRGGKLVRTARMKA